MELGQRFWSKVNKTDTCWLWTAGHHGFGYGRAYIGRRGYPAHRLSYEEAYGPIAKGLEVDHLCRVPACVRPDHLEAVTHRENVRRGNAPPGLHARTDSCPAGHPYDEANTYIFRGGRNCRQCFKRANEHRYFRRKVIALAKEDRVKKDTLYSWLA